MILEICTVPGTHRRLVHENYLVDIKFWVTFLGPIRWAIFEKVDEFDKKSHF
jgi:hypothetical protein